MAQITSELRETFIVCVCVCARMYLGWRFGDWGWSGWPESVVSCFFDTEIMRDRGQKEDIATLQSKKEGKYVREGCSERSKRTAKS